MNEKSNTKKSKRLVSAGVFIALYFVVFVIIGCCCMPVPPLYLCMTSLIALVAAPVYRSHAALPVPSAPGKHLGCCGDWRCGRYPG